MTETSLPNYEGPEGIANYLDQQINNYLDWAQDKKLGTGHTDTDAVTFEPLDDDQLAVQEIAQHKTGLIFARDYAKRLAKRDGVDLESNPKLRDKMTKINKLLAEAEKISISEVNKTRSSQ